jgi:hypothetical protein
MGKFSGQMIDLGFSRAAFEVGGKRQKCGTMFIYIVMFLPHTWIKKRWAFIPLIVAFCVSSQHPAPNYCFVNTSLTSSTPLGISKLR